MLGVPDQFWAPIVQVTPLKTPFGLLILSLQFQSHLATITHNYFLRRYACTQLTITYTFVTKGTYYTVWLLALAAISVGDRLFTADSRLSSSLLSPTTLASKLSPPRNSCLKLGMCGRYSEHLSQLFIFPCSDIVASERIPLCVKRWNS
jgi:hypothetical protein